MTVDEFRALEPSFKDWDREEIAAKLLLSPKAVNACRFGNDAAEAEAAWVAHELVIRAADGYNQTGEANPRADANDIIGSNGTSRASPLAQEQTRMRFMRTVHGQRYWQLAQQAGMGGIAG